MACLLTGGTGKSARSLIKCFQQANVPFIVTSRRGKDGVPSGLRAARLDWDDPATFEAPFQESNIKAIYLVAPMVPNAAEKMNPFIDLAVEKGVKRFVLIGGSTIVKGGPWVGEVYQHLDTKNVEYTLLGPTWFMENFTEPWNVASIKEGKIYSGTGDGKAPWVATKDIAEVAFRALTSPEPLGEKLMLYGPELVSCKDVAATLSSTIGHKVEHHDLSQEENLERQRKAGLPEFICRFMVYLEQQTKIGELGGFDPMEGNDIVKVLGRPPTSLAQWAEENKAAFI